MNVVAKIALAGCGLALAALSASAAQAASTPIFGTSGPAVGNQPETNLVVGMDFTVNSAVTIDSLGAFTNLATSVPVAIYTSAGTLVATTMIAAGTPTSYGYVFGAIAPVTLLPGVYQIAAYYGNSSNVDYNPYELYIGPKPTIVFNTDGGKLSFFPGNPDASPDFYMTNAGGIEFATIQDTSSLNGYGAGTFTAIPEPATWAMMALGLAGLAFAGHRASRGDRALA